MPMICQHIYLNGGKKFYPGARPRSGGQHGVFSPKGQVMGKGVYKIGKSVVGNFFANPIKGQTFSQPQF